MIMPNTEEVTAMLTQAGNDGELDMAIVIGKTEDGALRIFTPTADRDELNALLDRVKKRINQ